LENVTYEMGTDWNDSIDPNLKYLWYTIQEAVQKNMC
jgi:hypothetical protein